MLQLISAHPVELVKSYPITVAPFLKVTFCPSIPSVVELIKRAFMFTVVPLSGFESLKVTSIAGIS